MTNFIIKILFWLNIFIIIWAIIGYPLSLKLIWAIKKNRVSKYAVTDTVYCPTVTIMIVAHNEEKVIKEKLDNLIHINYPNDKLKIIVTSDCSTDLTNSIVKDFAKTHSEYSITLHETLEHKGKTNAQNEGQRLVNTEILVMTDANSMFESDAIWKLVQPFKNPDVSYVSGQLKYVNCLENKTASSESLYWKLDIWCREIESNIQTITAGNGAIYACRNTEYKVVPPIRCHDSAMPLLYALDQKRAVYCKDAIAYEKAGENDGDEFKRKVRMNRGILEAILPDPRILNIFKYKWFSYFYFGHRTCRYLLWIAHFTAFATNLLLINKPFYMAAFVFQIVFYLMAFSVHILRIPFKVPRLAYYYCLMIAAQWKGVFNIITGKAKPTWEKAESTR